MNWSDLTADLPAPRDDEPASLRQDIADELADHLQCAVRRESLSNPDVELARRKALDRFGNPQQIARQLWLDALWEKIMSQRIMLAVTIVLALTCLTATGMTWFVVERSRTAAEAVAAESRAVNAALMEQIAKLNAPATTPPPSLEWNNVQVRLVLPGRKAEGPLGYRVTLRGNVLDSGKETTINAALSNDGLADFGLVRAGTHRLMVQSPWGETTNQTIDIHPGQAFKEDILCPAEAPQPAEIKIRVDWPEDLRDKNLWLICDLSPLAQLEPADEGRRTWTIHPPGAQIQMLAISPENGLVSFSDTSPQSPMRGNSRFFDPNMRDRARAFPGRPQIPIENLGLRVTPRQVIPSGSGRSATVQNSELLFDIPSDEPQSQVQWPAVWYQLQGLVIARRSENAAEGSTTALKVIGGRLDDETSRRFGGSGRELLAPYFAPLDRAVVPPRYAVVAGQENVWNIAIPPEALEIVRKHLAPPPQ